MKVESTAPGKIFLSGEYLVLDGALATIMSTKQRVKVTIEDIGDIDNIFYCSIIDQHFPFNVDNNYQIIDHSNLTGNWLEIVAGVKVETFNNVYLGFSLRLNKLLSTQKPENFDNLYIPGFNKVTDDNTFGSGFNYTLTYSIPLRKKK